jgi:hypothetical protein
VPAYPISSRDIPISRYSYIPARPLLGQTGIKSTTVLVSFYSLDPTGGHPPDIFPHSFSSPRPPPSPWPPPPQASPPPILSTQPIPAKLRSGVDWGVLKLFTEDLRVLSTALGDRDLSSSSYAPCLRVNPFYLLLPLALATHSVCSCYYMSRSRVYLGLDPICLGIVCLGFRPLMA